MPPKSFKCKQCGTCCSGWLGYEANAFDEDIEMWKENGRDDILAWVDFDNDEEIWISPKTGKQVDTCPWRRKYPKKKKYYCRIYELRPLICRNYPLSKKHAEQTDCPGFKN